MTPKDKKAHLLMEWRKTQILAKYVLMADKPNFAYMSYLLKEMRIRSNETNDALLDILLKKKS